MGREIKTIGTGAKEGRIEVEEPMSLDRRHLLLAEVRMAAWWCAFVCFVYFVYVEGE